MRALNTSSKRFTSNGSVIDRTRRNHGLEHATLHVLSQRQHRRSLAGHSDPGGFWLIGDVSIEEVQEAVEDALARLRAGERTLAIHQNCGTNFVTAGVMAGLAAGVAMFGAGNRWRDKVERLPLAMVLATLAMILGFPVGMFLQERLTTSAQPGDLRVVEIFCNQRGGFKAYRVVTRG